MARTLRKSILSLTLQGQSQTQSDNLAITQSLIVDESTNSFSSSSRLRVPLLLEERSTHSIQCYCLTATSIHFLHPITQTTHFSPKEFLFVAPKMECQNTPYLGIQPCSLIETTYYIFRVFQSALPRASIDDSSAVVALLPRWILVAANPWLCSLRSFYLLVWRTLLPSSTTAWAARTGCTNLALAPLTDTRNPYGVFNQQSTSSSSNLTYFKPRPKIKSRLPPIRHSNPDCTTSVWNPAPKY